MCSMVLGMGKGARAQHRPAGDLDTTAYRYSAAAFLQGSSRDGFLDERVVDSIASAIRAIHLAFPEVHGVQASPARSIDALWLTFAPEAQERFLACIGVEVDSTAVIQPIDGLRTCLPAVDSLNRRYGAQRLDLIWGGKEARVTFGRVLDTSTLQGVYESLPEVEKALASPLLMAPPIQNIFLRRKPDRWHFVFLRGPDNCEDCYHWYYYTYNPESGRIEKDGELPANAPRDRGTIYLWGIPRLGLLQPFESYEKVESATRDPEWWVRQQAIEALHFLLVCSELTSLGAHLARSTEHFEMLDREVESRKKEVLLLLAEALDDPDPDVRQVAKRSLEDATGQVLDTGKEWKDWIEAGGVSRRSISC